jgi:hypothetical protein
VYAKNYVNFSNFFTKEKQIMGKPEHIYRGEKFFQAFLCKILIVKITNIYIDSKLNSIENSTQSNSKILTDKTHTRKVSWVGNFLQGGAERADEAAR